MAKRKNFSTSHFLALGIIGAVGLGMFGSTLVSSDGYSELNPPGTERVLITPFNVQADQEIRRRPGVEVRHEFAGKFSANVPTVAIPALEKEAKVEKIDILRVHANHPTGFKVKGRPQPGTRSCLPSKQREYNILQVNGGQLGAGTGVNVVALDSGANTKHLDLKVQICKDTTRRGIQEGCPDKSDSGHGTHVAGVVAANGGTDGLGMFGVAPSANLWVIKVCGNAFCFADDIAEGINFAADQGAQVINMSFGAQGESQLIKDAITAHPEVLFIASAGNSGPNPNTIEYPAANYQVLAVAANDTGKIVARFSSRGLTDGNDATIVERELELSAGGVAIESTHKDGCYSALSGTSFSSPTVAGLAAKVWQGSAAATRAYLVNLAQDITQSDGGGAGPGFDIASGYGLPVAP